MRKKDLQIPSNAQKLHTCAHQPFLSFSVLPLLPLCGLQIDKTVSILQPGNKQLIIYAILATKIHLAEGGTVHTLAHVHTCIHALQERVSYCQKTMEVGWLSYNFPAAPLPVCLCDINSTNLTCAADREWWKMFSQCVSAKQHLAQKGFQTDMDYTGLSNGENNNNIDFTYIERKAEDKIFGTKVTLPASFTLARW